MGTKMNLEKNEEYPNKVLEISDVDGYIWHLPVSVVADDRATYYAKHDPDTTYREEFDYLMEDDYEVKDWYLNNMNAFEIEPKFKLISQPAKPSYPNTDATIKIKSL